jgi:threonine/homoserine/homoserine lactone efflux protein
MDFQTIISFLIASSLLTIMPGPDIIYVLLQSISNGKKYGIITAFGLVSGIIVHTTLVAFGISELIKQSEYLFFAIKIFGALYLFYLALKVYQSPAKISIPDDRLQKEKFLTLYKRGFWMNVLNPKVSLFFLAFFPAFIDVSERNTLVQIYFLGLLFIVQAFVIFSIVAIISDKMTSFLRENKNFAKYLKIFQIIIFIAIGILILI